MICKKMILKGSRAETMDRLRRRAVLIAGQIMHEILKEENGQGQLRCASGCFMSSGPLAFDYRISSSGKDLQKKHFNEISKNIRDPAEIFRKPHVEGAHADERTANMGYDCFMSAGLKGVPWKAGWHKMKYSISKDAQASWFALHHQFDAFKARGYFREATTFRHAPIFASFLDGTKPLVNGGALEAAGIEPFPWSNFNNIASGYDDPTTIWEH